MLDGWIKLHRHTLENPVIMKDADHFAIWTYLLLNASHKEHDFMLGSVKTRLKEGQLVTGRKSISDKLKINESKVQRVLKLFENEHLIKQQTNNKNRVISILCWQLEQKDEQQDKQQTNNKRTASEQQMNTYNNDKNVENDNKNIYIHIPNVEKVQLTQEQYDKLVAEHGKEYIDNKILDLDNYIVNGKGSRYKDHNKVLRSWIRNDKKQNKKEEEYDPLYFK